jgi:hypothetical protein
VAGFDQMRRDLDHAGSLNAIDEFRASAFNILTSTRVANAFDISSEAAETRDRYPLHDPVTPQDLMATVYRHLGIDFERSIVDFSGRPIPILPHGRPIPQLI